MRTRWLFVLALMPCALACPSCDALDVGTLQDDPNPPRLVKILIQDELPRGGRNIATDLLEKSAHVACSDLRPCADGNQANQPCVIPDGQTMGVCPDPLDPAETPPALGTPLLAGGNQIRLVFDKALDPSIEKVLMDAGTQYVYLFDGAAAELDGPDGKPVPSAIYYDASGSPNLTSDIFVSPFGPAIVIKPDAPLGPGLTYTIKIDPSRIHDRRGQKATEDLAGPIHTTYAFTTEAMYPLIFSPDDTAVTPDGGGDAYDSITPNDVVTITLNTAADPATLKPTVTDGNGKAVEALAFVDEGADPMDCFEDDTRIDVVYAPGGVIHDWPPGTYTITLAATSAQNPSQSLKGDAFGKTSPPSYSFTVEGKNSLPADDPQAIDNFVLPGGCVTPGDGDMAMPGGDDMAMPGGDGGAPADMGVVIDLGQQG